MTNSSEPGQRQSAFSVFGGCPNLVLDLQTEAVVEVFGRGLQDPQSVDVSALPTLFILEIPWTIGACRLW